MLFRSPRSQTCRLGFALAALLPGSFLAASETAKPVRRIEVDFSAPTGVIRPLQGMNNGPWVDHFTLDLSHHFRELQVPHVRLHVPNWPGTDCVHIQTIFRNWDADPDDPASYDFTLTDDYVGAVIAAGAKPIYNIGLGVDSDLWNEAKTGEYKKARSNRPPADFQKFARICANIVRHYNQGWADGFHYNIEYWEIWNEPNLKSFWLGTQEEYVDLYAAVSAELKKVDPKLKVGGPAFSGGEGENPFEWLEKFLALCGERKLPLDFCTWHHYGSEHADPIRRARKVSELLIKYGYPHTENQLNEWSPCFEPMSTWFYDPVRMGKHFERTGGPEGAAFNASFLVFLQDTPVNIATFFTGDTIGWSFVDRHGAPKTSYFGFHAFRRMLDTPHRVKALGSDLDLGFAVLAGLSPDKSQAKILISNHRADFHAYEIHVRGLPWPQETTIERRVVDQTFKLDLVATDRAPARGPVVIVAPSATATVLLLDLAPSVEN